jgi:hypothetical protein
MCKLTKDKKEHLVIDKIFNISKNVEFSIKGVGEVQLTGYYEKKSEEKTE